MTAPSLVIPIHKERPWIYHLLFFGSGFPALIYQIVWQRSLFTLYGVNIESVTMIVAVFMLGLGLGSLAGGWLSARRGIRLLLTFGSIEILVGSFGAASLGIFHHVGAMTAGASTFKIGLVAFALSGGMETSESLSALSTLSIPSAPQLHVSQPRFSS